VTDAAHGSSCPQLRFLLHIALTHSAEGHPGVSYAGVAFEATRAVRNALGEGPLSASSIFRSQDGAVVTHLLLRLNRSSLMRGIHGDGGGRRAVGGWKMQKDAGPPLVCGSSAVQASNPRQLFPSNGSSQDGYLTSSKLKQLLS